MPVLIDTYNVLHVTGVLPPDLAGIDVAGLADLIAQSRYSRHEVHLFCDGGPGNDAPSQLAGVTLSFAGHDRTADDLIIAAIETSTIPRRLVVISSDREIQKAARRRRSRPVDSETFLAHLAADIQSIRRSRHNRPAPDTAKPAGPAPPDHVDAWIKAFALTEDDLALTASDLQPPQEPIHPVDDPLYPGWKELEDLLREDNAPDGFMQPSATNAQDPAAISHRSSLDQDTPDLDDNAAATESPPTPTLPADVIAQAEAFWKKQGRSIRRTAADTASLDALSLEDVDKLDMTHWLPDDVKKRRPDRK